MADGNINRLHPGTSSEHRAHDLVPVYQRTPLAPPFRHRTVLTDEAGFAHADAGQTCPNAQVAGQAKSPRVGIALAVADEQVQRLADSCLCAIRSELAAIEFLSSACFR